MNENKTKKTKLKIAAVGDLHITESSKGICEKLLTDISEKADVLVICGDLTAHGIIPEVKVLTQELNLCKIPIIAVLGNHDFENKKQKELKNILTNTNDIIVLDSDEPKIVDGVAFVGTKGFGGGFGDHTLEPWGEDTVKNFVYEAVDEALKLESALAKLQHEKKVVLLHYSPIRETVIGEDAEIFPYLGSSRLVTPINNFNADIVFHGHVHHGTHEGKTSRKIPVFNVALPLMKEINPNQPYFLTEI